jgi:outer membrane biosynthesis protein TonB
MGRHSAPNEEEPDDESATLTLVRDAGPATGRHAIDHDEQETVIIAPAKPDAEAEAAADVEAPAVPETSAEPETAAVPETAEPEAPAEVEAQAPTSDKATKAAAKQARREQKAATKAARGESNTRADLRMLRQNRALRLQCLLVVVIAFGVYTAVMLGLHHTSDTYLRWIWIPIVVSGVLVGACLDLAYRRAARKSEPAQPADPEA